MVKAQRDVDQRPCLTMNRVPQFVKKVTNEQRQQRPSPNVIPVGDGADVKTAEIFQGIIRHIQYQSSADATQDYEFDYLVRAGFGAYRIVTEYVDDDGDSLDQEIFIRPLKNPFLCYVDCDAQELDKSDMKYGFVFEDMLREDFKEKYGKDRAASMASFRVTGAMAPGWVTKEYIRVCEYFYVKETERQFGLVDGNWAPLEGMSDELKAKVTEKRSKASRQVFWSKITALDILEGGPLDPHPVAGRYIPLVVMTGDELDINGKTHRAGLVRDMKDPQRVYNYWQTSAAEMIALAPKAPWVVAEGQIENHREEWKNANRVAYSVLTYKPLSISGQAVPPPTRNAVEPPIAALAQMIAMADNDMKGVTGIYDASLGAPGPEQSGKAILLRQRQGDLANFGYSDNLARALRYTGKVLLSMIPVVYDTPRMQRIIKPDGKAQHVAIFNSKNTSAPLPSDMEEMKAERKLYDVGVGRYDVQIDVGPSYQTKRQEAAASMMAIMTAMPELIKVIGDLVVMNMDWPEAQAIADRLRKLVPPALLGGEDGQSPEEKAAALQAQLLQLAQQNQMVTTELQAALEVIKTKKLENDSKERIAAMNAVAGITEADIKAKAPGAVEVLNRSLDLAEQRLQELISNMRAAQGLPSSGPIAPAPGAPNGGAALPNPPAGGAISAPAPAAPPAPAAG